MVSQVQAEAQVLRQHMGESQNEDPKQEAVEGMQYTLCALKVSQPLASKPQLGS